jgi:hypothetical protein
MAAPTIDGLLGKKSFSYDCFDKQKKKREKKKLIISKAQVLESIQNCLDALFLKNI